jgi:hypothetical protein
VNRSEAVAIGLWRVRLDQTRTRCLAVAESSLAVAERLGRINPVSGRTQQFAHTTARTRG